MSPALVIVITGSSFAVSFTAATLGTSTSMPNSMTWAVNMKMMSSTSTTSTNGVTLISARLPVPALRLRDPNPLPPLTESAMLISETALRHIQKFHREIVHAGAHLTNLLAEDVVENSGWNCGDEADGGRDQRLGNARSQR